MLGEYSAECTKKLIAIKKVKSLINKWEEFCRITPINESVDIKVYENYIDSSYELIKAEFLNCDETIEKHSDPDTA